MSLPFTGAKLSKAQFQRISQMVGQLAGINLHVGKQELVKARLNKRLRELGMSSFDQYLTYLENDRTGNELVTMLDALSTNLTHFFREPSHFDYLRQEVLPRVLQKGGPRRIRIWSAGCSSGEEPYSIAVTLAESIPNFGAWDVRILATDLSTRVLNTATEGLYPESRLSGIQKALLHRHFNPVAKPKGEEKTWQVKPEMRQLITFARLNLMGQWPMKGPFDVIFCRNVMIYFEKPTQTELVRRFRSLLSPGGTLFIGHSESLTGTDHELHYVQPTVYERR